jgi:rhodanese-related sulfurtransferase
MVEAFQESLDNETRYRNQTKNVMRISPQQARSIYNKGGALLISVDQADYYKMEHIIGSINIPLETLKKVKLKVPKSQPLILYCR